MFFQIVVLFFSLSPALANAECSHDTNTFRCVKYVRNYDGDTITFNIQNVHPLLGNKISIRVNGIDTPELRTKNKCEKEKALKAKMVVQTILKPANRIDLVNIKRGKYFRIVADVIVDGKSISKILIKNKLAVKYDGGKKNKIDWCNPTPS